MKTSLFSRRTVKALIFNPHTKKFLLTRFFLSHGNNYGFVGGGVARKETLENALIREMKEEVGLGRENIENIVLLEGEVVNRLFLIIQNQTRMFLVVVKDASLINLNWESNGYVWTSFDGLEELLSPHYRSIFSQISATTGIPLLVKM